MALDDRDYHREHAKRLIDAESREDSHRPTAPPAATIQTEPTRHRYPSWLLWLAATGAIYNVTLVVRFFRWLTHT